MLTFHATKAPPFTISPHAATPTGSGSRIAQAAREALPTALSLRARALAQDDTDPVILVCAADCEIGRQVIEARYPGLSYSVCGPVCFAVSAAELCLMFEGAGVGAEIEALGKLGPGMLWCFAVNGKRLALRVMREESPSMVGEAAPISRRRSKSKPTPR